jgi:nicotinate phosphoribosyltransferase
MPHRPIRRPELLSTALLTDHYELTMIDAAVRDGTVHRPCVFETFARSLPQGRRYGVVAGLGRLLDALEDFRFDDAALGHLDDHDVVSPETLEFLSRLEFTGEIDAYPEGELYFPSSPVLTVVAPFGEAAVLETLALSVLNYDSAVASAASRMVVAARGRSLLEFGGRRTHEQAAVAAGRAAYLVGFSGTSNLEAGRRHGVPTLGTSAHSFTLLQDDELSAFAAQVEALGTSTTLLVDTYDIGEGLERAIAAGGRDLGGVRIDSGDLGDEARRARRMLDDAGATGTKIVLSGDLDEYRIEELADAPADGYGVGTSVVTGSGAPAAGFVYKLVARARTAKGPLEPVAKGGGAKATTGTRKAAARLLEDGRATAEHVRPWGQPAPDGGRDLQVTAVRDGRRLHAPGLEEIRAHHAAVLDELPEAALALAPGEAALPTRKALEPQEEQPWT